MSNEFEGLEDKLWDAFPSSEPVAANEIEKLILIWEDLRDTDDGRMYLEWIKSKQ